MSLNLNLGIPSVWLDSDMQGCICRLKFTFLSNEFYSNRELQSLMKSLGKPAMYHECTLSNPTIIFAEIAM